jgi:hypothetical protein
MNVIKRGIIRMDRPSLSREARDRLVAKKLIDEEILHCVKPESVRAPAEPEPHDVDDRREHLGIAPVELRLFRIEIVKIPGICRVVTAPRRASEHRDPVIRRLVAGVPDVPVGMLLEPRMLDRRMTGHHIEEDQKIPLVRFCYKVIEVVDATEQRIYIAVIRHIVSHVGLRRPEDRRQP